MSKSTLKWLNFKREKKIIKLNNSWDLKIKNNRYKIEASSKFRMISKRIPVLNKANVVNKVKTNSQVKVLKF